jgi:ParB/RepB/Spo0J family partition protein
MAKHKFENGINPLDEIKDKILKRDIPGARFLEIERIKVEEQVRKTFTEESIQELADSIKEVGLISPLTVKKIDGDNENFLLIAGERRLRALNLLGETKAQVIVRDIKDDQVELVQLIENLHREDVPPLELAEGYKLLQEKYGLSNVEVAKKIGKTEGHVRQILKILDISEDLQNLIRNGYEVSKALEISKLDKKTKKKVLKNVDNFSRDDIRKLRKENQESEGQEPENPEEETSGPKTEDEEPASDNTNAEEPEPSSEYEQIRNLMPGETTKALIDDFYGQTPKTEDQEPENLREDFTGFEASESETENQEPEKSVPAANNNEIPKTEDQRPEIDELIEEFNLKVQSVKIKNIGFNAISIWAEKEETLKDIIYGLKKKYCK